MVVRGVDHRVEEARPSARGPSGAEEGACHRGHGGGCHPQVSHPTSGTMGAVPVSDDA